MKSRIDKIIKAMQKSNLDAIAVIAGPNMAYLTGGDFFLMERPTVLIFSMNQRPLAILPSLEVDSFQALNKLFPTIKSKDEAYHFYKGPFLSTLKQAVEATNLKGKISFCMNDSLTIFVKITSAVGIKNFLPLSTSNFISNWSFSNFGNCPVPYIVSSETINGGDISL